MTSSEPNKKNFNFKQVAKWLFLLSGLVIVLIGVPRLILNMWLPYSNYLFYGALMLFAVALSAHYKTLLDLMSLRTTKYGLNMGTLVLLGVVLFVSVNFLSSRYDKSVDITRDKLNSLSLQSMDIVESLKDPVEFRVYYQGEVQGRQNVALKLLFKKYQRESSKIKTQFLDAYKDPTSSQFLSREDKGKLVVLVKKGERTERVAEPVAEESLTSALYRIEKTAHKTIYFLSGHGERPLEGDNSGAGLSLLKGALTEKGFKVSSLNLIGPKRVPEDAAMLAWIGPKKNLLESESKLVQDYLLEGGRLLVAVDPLSNVDINVFAHPMGVDYKKNFLLTTQPVAGGDALSVVGQRFSPDHAITAKLQKKSMVLFYEASELDSIDTDKNVQTEKLVWTTPTILSVKNLKNYQKESEGQAPQEVAVVMAAKGSVAEGHEGHDHGHDEDNGDKGKAPSFMVTFFGDSDLFSDVYFEVGFNKDLTLNAFASLSGETELLSVRPRTAKATKLMLTLAQQTLLIVVPVLIPLLLLIMGLILWFRRRGA